jgi:hypothetical protein
LAQWPAGQADRVTAAGWVAFSPVLPDVFKLAVQFLVAGHQVIPSPPFLAAPHDTQARTGDEHAARHHDGERDEQHCRSQPDHLLLSSLTHQSATR